jgi:hypothetical protein
MNKLTTRNVFIPNWVVWIQTICFSVLYAIWALPETILIRHVCLIIGALLSLWIIYHNRHLFFQKRAIPIWLIVALFAWATFHLFFLSTDFAAQYEEYTSIWKRVALGAIFALGFGIGLSNACLSNVNQKVIWTLIYLGLVAPTLIYIIKYFLTYKAAQWGVVVPNYLRLYSSSALFYLPKTAYVCFCLPALAVALGELARNIHRGQTLKIFNLFYILTVPAVLFVFYSENIKNGVVYGAALLILFFGLLVFHRFRQHWFAKLNILVLVLAVGTLFVARNIQSNPSWSTLWADAKIAKDTQTYQHWKYNGEKGYPNNELGFMVSITNYERIAWGKAGIQLIQQSPLGYGLIESSFGHLAKISWPDSKLHQSHSGWIDLVLGIGIPGFLLIAGALLTLLFQLARSQNQLTLKGGSYSMAVWWILFSLGIMWCTTEISQKVYFDDLIFWLSFGSGCSLLDFSSKDSRSRRAAVLMSGSTG